MGEFCVLACHCVYLSLNVLKVLSFWAGSCKDIDIGATSISQRTIYSIRTKQKWANLYAELQDGQYMLKVFALLSKIFQAINLLN